MLIVPTQNVGTELTTSNAWMGVTVESIATATLTRYRSRPNSVTGWRTRNLASTAASASTGTPRPAAPATAPATAPAHGVTSATGSLGTRPPLSACGSGCPPGCPAWRHNRFTLVGLCPAQRGTLPSAGQMTDTAPNTLGAVSVVRRSWPPVRRRGRPDPRRPRRGPAAAGRPPGRRPAGRRRCHRRGRRRRSRRAARRHPVDRRAGRCPRRRR